MDFLNKQWTRSPSWAKIATILALPTAGYIAAHFRDDYHAWLALGPGGLPYNLQGYITNLLVTAVLAKRDTKSTALYDHPEKHSKGWKDATPAEKANAQKSFLTTPLPQRSGPPSKAKHYVAPQRERNANEYFDPALRETYLKAFDTLASKHGPSIEWKTSLVERQDKAMFLKSPPYSIPTPIAKCQGEVAHLHDSDLTGHVLLSFADAREVIEKGWGERHRMTGTSFIPLGFTMVYQPRREEEVEVLAGIFEAG